MVQNLAGTDSRDKGAISEMTKLIPKEKAKVKAKIDHLTKEKAHLEQLEQDLETNLFEGIDRTAAVSKRLIEF